MLSSKQMQELCYYLDHSGYTDTANVLLASLEPHRVRHQSTETYRGRHSSSNNTVKDNTTKGGPSKDSPLKDSHSKDSPRKDSPGKTSENIIEIHQQSVLESSNIRNVVNNSSPSSLKGEISASITSDDDASHAKEAGHALIKHKDLCTSTDSVQNLIPISPPPLPLRSVQRKPKANRSVVRNLESEMYGQENKENLGKVNGNENIPLNSNNAGDKNTRQKDKFPTVYRSLPRMRNAKDDDIDLWEDKHYDGVDYIKMHISKYFTKKSGSKERTMSMYVKQGDLDLKGKGRSIGMDGKQGDLDLKHDLQGRDTSMYVKRADIEVVKTKQEVVERKREITAGKTGKTPGDRESAFNKQTVMDMNKESKKSSPKPLERNSTVELLERQLETGYTQEGLGERKVMNQQKYGNRNIEHQGKILTNHGQISGTSHVKDRKESDLIETPLNMKVHKVVHQAQPFKETSDRGGPGGMNVSHYDHHSSARVKHREMPNIKALKSSDSKTTLTVPKKFTSKYSAKAMDGNSNSSMESSGGRDKPTLGRPSGYEISGTKQKAALPSGYEQSGTKEGQKGSLTPVPAENSGSLKGSSGSVKVERREKGALTSLPVVGTAQSEPDMSKRRESLEAIKDHLRKQR